jgi:hypothetical protein
MTEVSVGTGLDVEIVKGKFAEVPPAGAGFVTVMLALLATAISESKISAASEVELEKRVVRGLPLKFTVEDGT